MAQEPDQSLRIELPFDWNKTSVEVIALPDSSLLIFSKTSSTWGSKATFNLNKYDANLKQVWSKALDIPSECEFIRYYTEAPYTYLALSGRKTEEYKFLQVHIPTGNLKLVEQEFKNIDSIYEYGVIQGNYFIIAHNSKDDNPVLLYLNPDHKEPQILPTLYDQRSSFSDLLIDKEHKRVDVVLTESNNRISRLQVKSFDVYGKLISNHFILQNGNRSLLNAEITPGDSTSKLLFGTFGTRDIRLNQGFFVADVASGVVNADFYDMLQLENFYKYMKPRREKRVRAREKARIKSGKEPLNQYRLLLHDLMPTPAGYLLAAEVYSPYSGGSVSTLNYPLLFPSSRRTEGYKRSHLVLLGFDRAGNLVWDNNFPMSEITTPTLTYAVEIAHTADEKIIIAYPDENKIFYQVIQGNTYQNEVSELELLRLDADEKIKDTYDPGVIRWYGSTFAAFGFKNKNNKSYSEEKVFYINKITF
ncbi:hypothetical protein C1N53_20805 [Pontibacter sp. SGAir0037]|nr:hypothetical protein C1N53_20805 [Pontibacter sp. SGAir0037]